MPLGETLLSLAEGAREQLLLVAPFMRADAVETVLRHVRAGVPVVCVTRWRPEEVLQGVSDLEVADRLADHGNSRLLLRSDLHAKLYQADDRALITSANLTRKALGWAPQPNLEFGVVVEASREDVVAFKEVLFAGAVEGDAQRRADVQAAVDALRAAGWIPPVLAPQPASHEADGTDSPETTAVDRAHWLPLCRAPDRLFRAYAGDTHSMTLNNFEDARRDLHTLGIPAGLDQATFSVLVAATLSHMPITKVVDDFLATGPRHVRELMALIHAFMAPDGPIEDTHDAWDTLRRWLLMFFPGRYRVSITEDGEYFQHGRVLGEWPPR